MAITRTGIRLCYELAHRMRAEDLGIAAAKRQITAETGMSGQSAQDYLYNTLHLLEGRSYTRTMNPEGTAAILDWIAQDHGPDASQRAVVTVLQHIEYYASLEKGGPQHEVRRVALDRLATETVTAKTVRARHLQSRVRTSLKGSRAARLKRLANADPRPKPVAEIVPGFIRNPDVIAEVLHRAAANCESCGKPAPFTTKASRPYLEVHHRTPLAEGGDDTVENAIALCPNCHREAHYGEHWQKFRH